MYGPLSDTGQSDDRKIPGKKRECKTATAYQKLQSKEGHSGRSNYIGT
jgi:hypothetical protein